MAERLTSDLLLDQLAAEGTRLIFGNPGPIGTPILDAVAKRSDIKFVLGLNEAITVSMANGYAQASNKPGVVILHSASALTGGISTLSGALCSRDPLVVLCAQQDTHIINELPRVYGDLCRLAEPFCKWVAELREPDEAPRLIRRAFQECVSVPRGASFISLPENLLGKNADSRPLLPPKQSRLGQAESGFLKRAAQLLLSASRPAIIVGNEVSQHAARKEVVSLVEVLGCPAYCEPAPTGLNFPNQHRQFAGVLPDDQRLAADHLMSHDVILTVGVQNCGPLDYKGHGAIPSTAVVVQMNIDPALAGAWQPCHFSVTADLSETIARLRAELQLLGDMHWLASVKARCRQTVDMISSHLQATDSVPAAPSDDSAISVKWLLSILDQKRPERSIVVNGTGGHSSLPLSIMTFDGSSSYFAGNCISRGWGLAAAVGIQCASPEHVVICLIGDGSMLHHPQALWTAAHYNLPVKTIVLNNQGYHSLSESLEGGNRGMFADLKDPAVSFTGLADAFGVPGKSISKVEQVQPALDEMFKATGPYLLDVRLET